MNLKKDITLGIIRAILAALGGGLVAKGRIDADTLGQVIGGVMMIVAGLWSARAKWAAKQSALDAVTKAAGMPFVLLFALPFLFACATVHVKQTDETPNARTITTEISGSAWFTSAQTISKLKATQTDKTQSFGTEAFGQHGDTNAVAALTAIARILEALRPVP
jgi:hypothetical protein